MGRLTARLEAWALVLLIIFGPASLVGLLLGPSGLS